jgi:hypothetical protein
MYAHLSWLRIDRVSVARRCLGVPKTAWSCLAFVAFASMKRLRLYLPTVPIRLTRIGICKE